MMNFITDMWLLWLVGFILAIGIELTAVWRFAATDDSEATWFGLIAFGQFLVSGFGIMLAISIIGNVILWVKGL